MTVFILFRMQSGLAMTRRWLENNNALQNTNKQSIIAIKSVCF